MRSCVWTCWTPAGSNRKLKKWYLLHLLLSLWRKSSQPSPLSSKSYLCINEHDTEKILLWSQLYYKYSIFPFFLHLELSFPANLWLIVWFARCMVFFSWKESSVVLISHKWEAKSNTKSKSIKQLKIWKKCQLQLIAIHVIHVSE